MMKTEMKLIRKSIESHRERSAQGAGHSRETLSMHSTIENLRNQIQETQEETRQCLDLCRVQPQSPRPVAARQSPVSSPITTFDQLSRVRARAEGKLCGVDKQLTEYQFAIESLLSKHDELLSQREALLQILAVPEDNLTLLEEVATDFDEEILSAEAAELGIARLDEEVREEEKSVSELETANERRKRHLKAVPHASPPRVRGSAPVLKGRLKTRHLSQRCVVEANELIESRMEHLTHSFSSLCTAEDKSDERSAAFALQRVIMQQGLAAKLKRRTLLNEECAIACSIQSARSELTQLRGQRAEIIRQNRILAQRTAKAKSEQSTARVAAFALDLRKQNLDARCQKNKQRRSVLSQRMADYLRRLPESERLEADLDRIESEVADLELKIRQQNSVIRGLIDG
jgi:hypothetical protein